MRRLAFSSWLRLSHWEYWPPWLSYVPLAGWIGALAVKHQGLTVFTAANPSILAGGFVSESKFDILSALSRGGGPVARSILIAGSLPASSKRECVAEFCRQERLSLPIVLKPNEGQRGSGVVVARTREQLHGYLDRSVVDTIVQEYVPGLEFGVFYVRRPSETIGRIFSVTEKRLPFVVGDGQRSLERLILGDRRLVGMARFHLEKHHSRLNEIPEAGQIVSLGDLGTHCRGAQFLDGRSLLTPELERAFDRISKDFDGFFFGRYDVRAPSVDDFRRGTNITVIELNGVTSEATHIYDPAVGLVAAYGALFEQWRLAFEIGAENVRRGAPTTSIRELMRLLRRYRATSQDHLDEPSTRRRSLPVMPSRRPPLRQESTVPREEAELPLLS